MSHLSRKGDVGPTRRDFLGAAGGAFLASRLTRAQESRIPARFVGYAFDRGHHWLTPDPEKLQVDQKEKKGVVIVGAGIAGVVAAWRLLEAGVDDFVVLELEDRAGGLARNGLMGTTTVPFGGVLMGVPNESTSPAVVRLLDAAGVERNWTSFRPREFRDGRFRDGPYDDRQVLERLEFLPKAAPVGSHADTQFVAKTGAFDIAEMKLATSWSLVRWGTKPTEVSSGPFWDDVERRFRGGQMLVVPSGLASLLTPLLAKIGPRLLTGRVALLAKPDGPGAVVRAVNAADAIVTDYATPAAILALPPFLAARIAPSIRARDRDRDLELLTNTPWLVTAVMVSRWPKGFDPAALFHQFPDERASLILHVGTPPGAVIVFQRPFPSKATLPARMFLRDLDPDGARDWAFREVAAAFPDLREVATRVELWRVGHGQTRPIAGYVTKIAPKLREPAPPLYPCGADHAGVACVESAITDGVRGAEAVLQRLGKLDRSWL